MNVIVTTGPSFEPIDEVRRLTNFSTGELGVLLANHLTKAGHQVFCLKGVGATCPAALQTPHHLPFTTNQDLHDHLVQLSRTESIHALCHVAALCDFKVKEVQDTQGRAQSSAKIDSRASALTIHLEPAKKIISELRSLFPNAALIGWKYELAGSQDEALGKAWRQLRENRTDACVLNGRAYGSGFAFCTPPDQVHPLREKSDVVEYVANWLPSFSREL
jgi:phosphopantothenoylcysteine synthetase/decarboxylase